MLTTVEGVFKNGRIELEGEPPALEESRVIVTFLADADAAVPSPSDANVRMLDLLRAWETEPLSPEEDRVLGDFEAFQARHPLRLARLDDEP